MEILGYNFTEPESIIASNNVKRAAVYVVLTHNNSKWFYLYVGQTKDVDERFEQHEKWNCWLNHKEIGGLYVSILLISDKDERLKIETVLRNNLPGLVCNKQ